MAKIEKIVPNLWFDTQAEDAARFYCSVFKNSSIERISYYTEAGRDIHKRNPGSVMLVEFYLEGQKFMALNGGPNFKFNEAVSFVVSCKTQKEVDFFWDALSEGGDPAAQQCGWLKDKFGLSWQVTPSIMGELMSDRETAERVMETMMKMKKIDIQALKDAAREELASH